mgnify:CR=1 FL=1
MLISGYSDAQREAVKAGAVPGFGKDDLRSEVAAERIAAALGVEPAELVVLPDAARLPLVDVYENVELAEI